MTNSEVLDRIAALEADMAQMKRQVVTREMFDQLLTYLGRIDGNIASMSADMRQMRGDIAQLNTRVERVEESVSVLPELVTKVERIGNDIRRLAQEM